MAWYNAVRKNAPLRILRYPVPGKFLDRPALDTGDVFERRDCLKVEGQRDLRYFYHSRADDQLQLSTLYRPDVGALEAKMAVDLTRPGRLLVGDFNAVQLFGDKKPRLAMVVQLRKQECTQEELDRIHAAVTSAVQELDDLLPDTAKFKDIKMVRIVMINDAGTGEPLLEKTHKDTLRRVLNVVKAQSWLDSLDWL